ncbi:hypothetical protein L211DRAFT_835185, partial [Terfezia boudieri ATCC MYA-4762]
MLQSYMFIYGVTGIAAFWQFKKDIDEKIEGVGSRIEGVEIRLNDNITKSFDRQLTVMSKLLEELA